MKTKSFIVKALLKNINRPNWIQLIFSLNRKMKAQAITFIQGNLQRGHATSEQHYNLYLIDNKCFMV